MAGKRQHVIPQFLQRGFLSRVRRRQEFTHVYRKDASHFQTNIKNVGVESFFYSASGNDADEVITAAEDALGGLIDELRRGRLPEAVRLAELFAHLEARSRHLRHSILQCGTCLVDSFLETLSEPEVFEPYVRRMLRDDPSLLEEAFAQEIGKRGLPQGILPTLMKQASPLVEKVVPVVTSQFVATATHLRAELPDRFKSAAKTGHVRALKREVVPAKKVAILSDLKFQVCQFPGPSLLLGDSMVLFHVRGERRFKPFLEENDELVAAILPIAADAALVGAAGSYTPEVNLIRCELARSSLEFFITSEESERNSKLSGRIAENAQLLSHGQVQEMVRALVHG